MCVYTIVYCVYCALCVHVCVLYILYTCTCVCVCEWVVWFVVISVCVRRETNRRINPGRVRSEPSTWENTVIFPGHPETSSGPGLPWQRHTATHCSPGTHRRHIRLSLNTWREGGKGGSGERGVEDRGRRRGNYRKRDEREGGREIKTGPRTLWLLLCSASSQQWPVVNGRFSQFISVD